MKEKETPKLSEIWWERGIIPGTNEFTTHERWKRVYDQLLSLEAKIALMEEINDCSDRASDWRRAHQLESEYKQLGKQHGLI
jgi:hypothetical protein